MTVHNPLIILSPPRSYSTLVGAMIGQHPQMYGLLETFLFRYNTLQEWEAKLGRTVWSHGLLRVIAELIMGEQNEATINQARAWIRRRRHWKTGDVFKTLAERVYPLIPVVKDPQEPSQLRYIEVARKIFPGAKFLHLTRHPIGNGKSVIEKLKELYGSIPERPEPIIASLYDLSTTPPSLDPQFFWYKIHSSICSALEMIPSDQQMRVRGEDILADPDHHLREIAAWLGLRTDPEAIEAMKHPEQSVYARVGPPNARLGGDLKFLEQPFLRSRVNNVHSLVGPLPWRKDGCEFKPGVRELAQQFGYE